METCKLAASAAASFEMLNNNNSLRSPVIRVPI